MAQDLSHGGAAHTHGNTGTNVGICFRSHNQDSCVGFEEITLDLLISSKPVSRPRDKELKYIGDHHVLYPTKRGEDRLFPNSKVASGSGMRS
jgi:hypothetical protein